MAITGGCLCKAVRYSCTSEPTITRACWCRLCQYIGAGSNTVNVFFASADFTITGELTDYVCVADSGTVMHRRFCPKCGTANARPVIFKASRRPAEDREKAPAPAKVVTPAPAEDEDAAEVVADDDDEDEAVIEDTSDLGEDDDVDVPVEKDAET